MYDLEDDLRFLLDYLRPVVHDQVWREWQRRWLYGEDRSADAATQAAAQMYREYIWGDDTPEPFACAAHFAALAAENLAANRPAWAQERFETALRMATGRAHEMELRARTLCDAIAELTLRVNPGPTGP